MSTFIDAAWYILGTYIFLEGVAQFRRDRSTALRKAYWGALIVLWAAIFDLTVDESPLRWLVFVTSLPLAPLFYLGVKSAIDEWWSTIRKPELMP